MSRAMHTAKFCALAGALMIGAAVLPLALASPARAFCVQNMSDTRLLFVSRQGGGPLDDKFRKWLGKGQKTCGEPSRGSAIVEIFVFSSEDALEGCDAEVGAMQTLILKDFAKFDNCFWAVP